VISPTVILNRLGLCELKTTKLSGCKNNVRFGLGLVYELLSHEELTAHLLLTCWCCVTAKFVVLRYSGRSVKFSLKSRNILWRERELFLWFGDF